MRIRTLSKRKEEILVFFPTFFFGLKIVEISNFLKILPVSYVRSSFPLPTFNKPKYPSLAHFPPLHGVSSGFYLYRRRVKPLGGPYPSRFLGEPILKFTGDLWDHIFHVSPTFPEEQIFGAGLMAIPPTFLPN